MSPDEISYRPTGRASKSFKKREPALVPAPTRRSGRTKVKIDPKLKALIDCNLKKGMKITKSYALS
jgi:hypothetical protein